MGKLEGLWWGSQPGTDFSSEPQGSWNWKLIIRVPDFIGQGDVKKAVSDLVKKGKSSEVAEVRLETMRQGLCVQMLHVGPYDRERDTMAKMKQFTEEKGLSFHGLHHEIYLSDPRRVAPEKLRTILRMPVH